MTTWIDLESIMISEIRTGRERQIPYHLTYMWNVKNKTNKQNEKWTRRSREQTDGYQMGGGFGGWVKRVKGLRSTHCQLQNSHGDVKYSAGTIVNNIIMTMYSARWVLELLGDHFMNYMNVYPLHCVLETNRKQ